MQEERKQTSIGNIIIEETKGLEREIIEKVINSVPLINLISDEPKRIVNLLIETEEKIRKKTTEITGKQIIKLVILPFNLYSTNEDTYSPNQIIAQYKKTGKTFDPSNEKLIVIDIHAKTRMEVDHSFLPKLIENATTPIEPGKGPPYLENSITYITISEQPIENDAVFNIFIPPPTEEEIRQLLEEQIKLFQKINPELNLTEEEKYRIVQELRGLKLQQIEIVLKSLLREKSISGITNFEIVKKAKETQLRKVGLEPVNPVSIENIGGLYNLKDYLKTVEEIFKLKEKPKNIKEIPSLKGILLTGVPGTGKSLTAKALGSILQIPIVKLNMSNILSKWIGESEANFTRILKTIETLSPVILLIDEIEKTFTGEHEVSQRLLGTFLNWLQENNGKVYVVATANKIQRLPVELTRTGRWDKLFYFDFPTYEERYEIAKIHLNKYLENVEEKYIKYLAEITEEYTGSEIEQIAKEIAIEKIKTKEEISFQMIDRIKETVKPISKTRKEELHSITELEERGFIKANNKPETKPIGII